MQIGRRVITTDVLEVTPENIIQILKDAKPYFTANALQCGKLLEIEAGNQPLGREKKVRKDIDVQTVDNLAHEITEFKEGYHWGNLITFVQRGGEIPDGAIGNLNYCYAAENAGRKQRKLGHFVEICGIGYTFIDIKGDWEDGDSYFDYEVLDPRCAFVIRSSVFPDHRVMLGATFRADHLGNRYYTVFSKDRRYEVYGSAITNGEKTTDGWGIERMDGAINPLGMVPIIEWERADDRMGVFEREIPEMSRLNLLLSDIANDVDQETQMIWHTNDVDFPPEVDSDGEPTGERRTPKSNDWVSTFTSRDGKTPFIKPLSTAYDYAGLMGNYTVGRSLVLQRCYTPQRNDNSGGSTGTAMSDATGWSAAEQVACAQQLLMESSKMDELKVVLAAIRKSGNVPSNDPLLSLRCMDVKPNVTRQKTYEMTVKINAYATGVSHGIAPEHMIKAINFFEDAQQVINDSAPYMKRYLDSLYNDGSEPEGGEGEGRPDSDRLMPDESDQTGNSPLIDGMSTAH